MRAVGETLLSRRRTRGTGDVRTDPPSVENLPARAGRRRDGGEAAVHIAIAQIGVGRGVAFALLDPRAGFLLYWTASVILNGIQQIVRCPGRRREYRNG